MLILFTFLMYPLTHFLVGFLLGLVFLDVKLAFFAGLVALLLDLDHFIEFVLVKKRFSLREAWNDAVVKHVKYERSFLHHWKGFLLVSVLEVVLYFLSLDVFFVVLIGYYSHYLLDHVSYKTNKFLKFKEKGFVFKIAWWEVVLDVVLVLILLMLFL